MFEGHAITCALATTSYCCARMSTSLPLPSSPHCVPSTTATCASSATRSVTGAAASAEIQPACQFRFDLAVRRNPSVLLCLTLVETGLDANLLVGDGLNGRCR